jgi:hypothetical protein
VAVGDDVVLCVLPGTRTVAVVIGGTAFTILLPIIRYRRPFLATKDLSCAATGGRVPFR